MKKLIFSIFIVALCANIYAQNRIEKYDAYIEKYAPVAVQCQKEHHIPASITLAQALLESAAGESSLARECNNHFGIKCGGSWYGRTMNLDDDIKNECFRCYSKVIDSYEDHAEFLKRQRYSFLYDYEVTDYKSWANGLKQAGYATDPNYATKLIALIELYELYVYDKEGGLEKGRTPAKNEKVVAPKPENTDQLFGYVEIENNGVKCYKLLADDSFENISKATGISVKNLLYVNDLPHVVDLYRGDYVYLTLKKNSYKGEEKYYTVREGDSFHSIAQEYGIRLKKLYKMNGIEYGTPAKVGQKLKLRKK